MKNVLFTTTALLAVAFAGTASADGHTNLSWGGSAEFGYYAGVDADGTPEIDEGGLDAEAGINFTLGSTLDNGVTAKMTYGFDIDYDDADQAGGGAFGLDGDEDVEVEVAGSDFKVIYGGENYAGAAGSVDNDEGNTLYAETSFGDITASLSRHLGTSTDDGYDEDLELGIAGDFGDLTWGLGYNDQGDGGDEVFGVKLGYALADFDVSLEAATDDSYDLTLGYDAGDFGGEVSFETDGVIDVKATGSLDDLSFAVGAEDLTEENGDMNPFVEVNYDMAPVAVLAAWSDDHGIEAGINYDLGGGASAIVSYGEALNGNDETQTDTYDEGFEAILKFTF